MSEITPERLDELEQSCRLAEALGSNATVTLPAPEVREFLRGYRAGRAAERELAAARDALAFVHDLTRAYDAARKGEVDAGAGGGGGGIRDGAAEHRGEIDRPARA